VEKPVWFDDEIRRISEKREITAAEAEASILARVDEFAVELDGDMVAAYEAYNLERIDCINEDYFVVAYMRDHDVDEEVARAIFNSVPF